MNCAAERVGTCPCLSAPAAAIAASTSLAASNANGRISCLSDFASCLPYGGDDVRIGRATAKIAAHILADIAIRFGVALLDAAGGRHDLARRAIAALEGVIIDEGLLQRMQGAVFGCQAFDGGDLAALMHDGEAEA